MEWFVPPEEYMDTQDSKWTDAAKGKRICLTVCPVTTECLMTHYQEDFGVWGGTRPTERKRFKRLVKGAESARLLKSAENEVAKQRKEL